MPELQKIYGQFVERGFYGNSLLEWLVAALVALAVFFALRWLRGATMRRLERGAKPGGRRELLAQMVRRIHGLWLLILALGAGAYLLDLPNKVDRAIETVELIALFGQLAILGAYLFSQWAERYAETQRDRNPSAATMMGAVTVFGRAAIYAFAIVLTLDNLGFDVTALLAGLGIGGVAIAIASQSILSDLFASLSIVFDKPFVVGDFIILDSGYLGTVERVGVKTTRIRSLSGEQIVISNADLLKTRIRNYKRMYERRVDFRFGVAYGTPPEKLERIGPMIREIVESLPAVRFDRAHFSAYSESALTIEVVYYVQSPDYNLYMDRQQAINLGIMRRFAEEGIEFALPTRIVRMPQVPAALMADADEAEPRHLRCRGAG